jgi:hypothetical protein
MGPYPRVEHSHIVPQTYLRNFADQDDMIGMRLVDGADEEEVISIRDAAVRKRFYRRTRPDGTSIDDIEHSLGSIETRVGPILRDLEARWPLNFEAKRILGEFFAVQLLRGVRWRKGYEKRTARLVEDYRRSGLFAQEVTESGLTPEEISERNREFFSSDTMGLRRMLFTSPKGSAVFGSMSLVASPLSEASPRHSGSPGHWLVAVGELKPTEADPGQAWPDQHARGSSAGLSNRGDPHDLARSLGRHRRAI